MAEEKREALLREASQGELDASVLEHKLAHLDSTKPCPYGTMQAVCIHLSLLNSCHSQ